MGTTKVKGVFKGLRYLSQMFDERKQAEMQIGSPTDVKHVAHIGWDGPSNDSPSWMKGFESANGSQPSSSSMTVGGEVQCDREGSKLGLRESLSQSSRDQPDIPKSTRRTSSKEVTPGTDSPKKQKSRSSRRQRLKDSVSSRLGQDESIGTSGCPTNDPALDVPKKSRRKKPKDPNSTQHHRSSRSRGSAGSGSSYISCTSDPESSLKSSCSNKEHKERVEAR